MILDTYALSLSHVEFSPNDIEFVHGVVLAKFHEIDEVIFFGKDSFSLLLVLLDGVTEVSLALLLELLLLDAHVDGVLLVKLHLVTLSDECIQATRLCFVGFHIHHIDLTSPNKVNTTSFI